MLKAFLNTDAVRFLASWFITQYVRLTWYSGRWTHHGATANQQFWQEQKPMILALWHGRLLMMSCTWPRGLPFYMLVSKHRDGLIISRAIKALGIDSIRGSAKKPGSTKDKGGFSAIREIITTLKTGKSIGITPDGPRGPRMHASDGVVAIARLSGVPVIPSAWSSKRCYIAKSWDRMMIPTPFDRGFVVWGEPISVPRDANEQQLEAARLQIAAALNAVTQEADRLAGVPLIEPAPLPGPSTIPQAQA